MSTSRPDESLIVDIANACSIQEAFVEKDYYATVCLRALSEFRHDDVNQVIFTGGTSLTKGWHLMQRFSEDLDFEIVTKAPLTRKKTHAIRHALRDCLSRIENVRLSEPTPAVPSPLQAGTRFCCCFSGASLRNCRQNCAASN